MTAAAPAPDAELPPPPTPEAAALARLIGRRAAFALIEAHGGTRIYVPETPDPDTVLAGLIGLDALRSLSQKHGGTHIFVTQAKAWCAIVYRHRDGLSHSAIARKVGANESSVYQWLRQARSPRTCPDEPAAPPQLDLFMP